MDFLLGAVSSCQDVITRLNVQEVFGDTPINDKQEEQVKFGMASDHNAGLTSMDGQKEERRII